MTSPARAPLPLSGSAMRLLPESADADDLYGPFSLGEHDLVERIVALAEEVRGVVASCVGLSLSVLAQDVTFTVVASSSDVVLLDAIQYVDGGPCTDALHRQEVVVTTGPKSIEEQWELFGRSARAAGVASTLSLPMVELGQKAGGFNLYASEPHAFDAHVGQVADILGSRATSAVHDGDLVFGSRERAKQASEVLRDSARLTLASSLLARDRGMDLPDAEARLRSAAERAHVSVALLAEHMIEVLRGP